ncbi:MAG TPA: hypothetical protein VHF22_08495 [Planctomycetota bacterium]|nr:hypothetical protein [Planctomycetota bacterium]
MAYGPTLLKLEPNVAYKAVAPQKIPIGGSVKGTKKPGLFKVYVPMRDGPTLELKTTAGKITVFDPKGVPAVDAQGNAVAAGANVKFDVPDGVLGWFGVVVTDSSSYEVSAKLSINGNARDLDGKMLIPWNFYYFPFTQVTDDGAQHPSAKWQAKFGGGANDWEKSSYWKGQIEGTGGAGHDGHGITKQFVDEYNKWAGSQVVDFDNTWWWGHCDAASVASALFNTPKSTDGFSDMDIRFFATEISMRGYEIELKFFLGGLDNTNRRHPSHTEKPEGQPGQSLDKDLPFFHDALIDVVKKQGAGALIDFRAEWEDGKDHSPDVWNQLTYKFTMEATQAKADASPAEAETNARQLAFKTTLYANCDAAQSSGDPESNPGSGWLRELSYVLNYDGSGKAVMDHPANNFQRCTWSRTGKDYYAPRYIFQVKGLNSKKDGPGNPHITLDKAKTLGLQLRKIFGG